MDAAQGGFVIWLTGLPASGKTTVARALQAELARRGEEALLVDSDVLRGALTPEPVYTEAERERFYRVLVYVARWLAARGISTLIAATAHRRSYRDLARAAVPRFAEVFVATRLAVCQQRDPKGIYRLAARGEAHSVPGVGVPFEAPAAPEATITTEGVTPQAAAEDALRQLVSAGILPADLLAAPEERQLPRPPGLRPPYVSPSTTLQRALRVLEAEETALLPIVHERTVVGLLTRSGLEESAYDVALLYRASPLRPIVLQTATIGESASLEDLVHDARSAIDAGAAVMNEGKPPRPDVGALLGALAALPLKSAGGATGSRGRKE
ncbi:MAG: adenylyl-sulfate kinase, partial [Candidatus Promineifilaceae bacterium]|nr:adenylyl-sulfate kinase [Candidatus Promineifilaceae bacterium]